MLKCTYLVIGSGQTGITLTQELLKTGKKVFLVEQSEFGGGFLNSYEYPNLILDQESKDFASSLKLLKNNQEVFSILRKYRQKLISKLEVKVKKKVNSSLNKLEKSENFKYFTGKAEFFSKSLVEVNSDEERNLLSFEQCLIAIGKNTMSLPAIKGLDKGNFLFRHNVFSIDKIPSKLGIIGCTKESLEIASIFANLGVKSEIYDTSPSEKILPELDRSAFNYLIKSLSTRQIDFNFETQVNKIALNDKSYILHDSNREEKKFSDIYVNVTENFSDDGINLAKIGVKYTKQGIANNGHGRTTAKNIWAFGECSASTTPDSKFSQIFSFTESEIEKQSGKSSLNLADLTGGYFGDQKVPSLKVNNFKINTFSPVITIGYTQQRAVRSYGTYIKSLLIEDLFLLSGFLKIVYKENNDQILGVSLAGDFAKILEEKALLAIKKGVSKKQFRDFIKVRFGV